MKQHKADKASRESRVMFVRVPAALAERVEDARYWARIPSLVAFGIDALTHECERLEREQNKGKRFEPRPASVRRKPTR